MGYGRGGGVFLNHKAVLYDILCVIMCLCVRGCVHVSVWANICMCLCVFFIYVLGDFFSCTIKKIPKK